MLRVPGVTLMVAMRCWTTTSVESFVPPASVATTYVDPSAIAVMTPAEFTVATPGTRLT